MVAGLDGGYAWPHLLHDTCSLMPRNKGEGLRHIALHKVEVAVTHTGGLQPHQYLIFLRVIEGNILYL
jgi:hypothetical protein